MPSTLNILNLTLIGVLIVVACLAVAGNVEADTGAATFAILR